MAENPFGNIAGLNTTIQGVTNVLRGVVGARRAGDDVLRTDKSDEGVRTSGNEASTTSNQIRTARNRAVLASIGSGGEVDVPQTTTRTRRTRISNPNGGEDTVIQTDEQIENGGYDRYNPQGRRGLTNPQTYSLSTRENENDVAINGEISAAEAARVLRRMSNDERVALADNLQRATGIQIFSRSGGVRIPELAAAATEYGRAHFNDISALEAGDIGAWRQLESHAGRNGQRTKGYGQPDRAPSSSADNGQYDDRHNDGDIDRQEALTGFLSLPSGQKAAFIRNLEALTNSSIPIEGNGEPAGIALSQAVTSYARQRFNNISPLEAGNVNAWRQLADSAAFDAANLDKTPLQRSQQQPPSGNGSGYPLEPRTGGTPENSGASPVPARPAPITLPPEDPEIHSKINALIDAGIKAKNLSPEADKALREYTSSQLGDALTILGVQIPKGQNPEGAFSAWLQKTHPDIAAGIKGGTPEAASSALKAGFDTLQQEALAAQAAYKQQGQAQTAAQPAKNGISDEDLANAFREMENNPDKYGKKPLKYVDNIKKGLGMSDTNGEVTPEFIHKFAGALNQYADPNTLEAIKRGEGFPLRRVADHVCQDYRDGLKETAQTAGPLVERGQAANGAAPTGTAAPAGPAQMLFVNGHYVARGPESRAEFEKMLAQSITNGHNRAERDAKTYADYAASHQAPAVVPATTGGAISVNLEAARQAAANNAQLNDPHATYRMAQGTQLHPDTASASAPAIVPSAQPKPAALTPEQQQLAAQVTQKFNQKLAEFKEMGLLDDKTQKQIFGEAEAYLNKVGIPTNDGNVVQNAIAWGVKNQPDQVKTILAHVDDNPIVMLSTAKPAFEKIVEALKQQAAMQQAKGLSVPGVSGGQSTNTVVPSAGGPKFNPAPIPALGQ